MSGDRSRQCKAMGTLIAQALKEERCRGALVILEHRLMPVMFKSWIGAYRRQAIKHMTAGLVAHDRILHGREL